MPQHILQARTNVFVAAPVPGSLLTSNTLSCWSPMEPGSSGEILTMVSGRPTWATAPPSSLSMGDTITDGTAGSNLFVDSSGNLAQDNANWRYRAGGAGITVGGSGSFGRYAGDQAGLMLVDDGEGSSEVLVTSSNGSIYLGFDVTGGTFASPTALSAEDGVMYWDWSVKNGAGGYSQIAVAEVIVDAVDSDHAGRFAWSTANVNGTMYERLRLTSQGTTGIASPDSASTVVMAGQTEVQGDIIQTGADKKLGLFGAAAAVQQNHIADPAANAGACATAIAAILDALEAYGLLATS